MNKPIIAVLAAMAVLTSTTGVAYAQCGSTACQTDAGSTESVTTTGCKNVNSSVYYGRTAVT